MKKILIFVFAFLVLTAMILSFVACGDEESNPGESSGTDSSVGDNTNSSAGSTDSSAGDNTDSSAGSTDSSVGDNTDSSAGSTDSSVGDNTDSSEGSTDSSVGDNTDSSIGSTDSSVGDNTGNVGNEDVVCAHESIKVISVKFSDYGVTCGGGICFEQCTDCEEILEYESETLVTLCTYEDGTDGKCIDCGLEVIKAVSQNGCDVTTTYSVAFGEAKIFEGATRTSTEHNLKLEITEQTEENCLVTVATESCKDCDFTNLLSTLHEGCELDISNEQVEGKSIRTSICTECGYKEIREYTEASDCTGEQAGHIARSLYDGESLLCSGETDREKSHSLNTTFIQYGSDCENGIAVIKMCVACGEREYETALDHVLTEKIISIEEIGSCSSHMTVKECSVCERVFEITEKPDGCYFKLTKSEYNNDTLSENYECVDCGLVFTSEKKQSQVSECEIMVSETVMLSKDGETVLLVESEYAVNNHYESSYTYTYELLGKSCLDGIAAIGVCKNCGYTVRSVNDNVDSHKTKSTENIEIDTFCGSTLVKYTCICGEVEEIYSYDGCEFLTTGVEHKEIDGVKYEFTTKTCAECGAERIYGLARVEDDCIVHCYEQIIYVVEGETIYDTGICDTYIAPMHETVRKNMAFGISCEIDGMLTVEACRDCDYYSYNAYDYHYKTKLENIDISEQVKCGGYIEIEKCPCDVGEMRVYFEEYLCEFEHTAGEDENGRFNKYVCKECGFTVNDTIEYTYDNCQRITEETYVFSIDGEVLYEYKQTFSPEEFHQLETTFRLLAEHCYDGLYEISKCKDCDYEKVTAHYNCIVKERLEFGFGEYGVCDGAYYYTDCYCGMLCSRYYSLYCNLVEIGSETETIDGITYTTTTYTCETCGVVETVVNYVDVDGCYEYNYFLRTVKIGEKVLAENVASRSYHQSYHMIENSFELLGTSCEDGYYMKENCTKCDYEASVYYDSHHLYQKYYYDGGDDCIHSVVYYECACARVHDLSVFSVDEAEDGYACDKCGLKIVESAVTEKEKCKGITETTHQVYIGDETVIEFVDIFMYDSHSFDEPLLSNQDGKDVITSKCKDCGFELIQEIYILVYEDSGWSMEGSVSFTVSQDGEYTVYISSIDAKENMIITPSGEFIAGFYLDGETRPVGIAQLEKDTSYECISTDYYYIATLSAFAVIEGQYNVCAGTEGTIKLTTSDGKYELTLCDGCHMILDVEEITK